MPNVKIQMTNKFQIQITKLKSNCNVLNLDFEFCLCFVYCNLKINPLRLCG
jgi:hypothetical protein